VIGGAGLLRGDQGHPHSDVIHGRHQLLAEGRRCRQPLWGLRSALADRASGRGLRVGSGVAAVLLNLRLSPAIVFLTKATRR